MESNSEADNEIHIGQKDTTVYVFAVQTQSKLYSEIIIKARGKSIQKAVDVSQIALNKFLYEWEVSAVKIGSEDKEQMENERVQKISFIKITMKKK